MVVCTITGQRIGRQDEKHFFSIVFFSKPDSLTMEVRSVAKRVRTLEFAIRNFKVSANKYVQPDDRNDGYILYTFMYSVLFVSFVCRLS